MIDTEHCDCGWHLEHPPRSCICGKPLTSEQLTLLSDGEVVTITWSGGNGPARYRFRRRHGVPCAVLLVDEQCLVGVIDFVGPKQPHTVVRWVG